MYLAICYKNMARASILFVFYVTSLALNAALELGDDYSTSLHESANDLLSLKRQKRTPQEDSSGKCILPSYPLNGGYTVKDIAKPAPGQVHDSAIISVTCHAGFRVTGKTSVFCIAGMWSGDMPKCIRYCKLEKEASVTHRCLISPTSFEEGYRECNEFEPLNTVVKPECRAPNYYYSGVLSYMRCQDSGWDYIATCIPECGRVTPGGDDLILEGRNAVRGEFPWHAGIYSKTSTPYKQICGGSLVSTTVVLSAAHCFWDKQIEKILPETRYAVALGKLYRPWNNTHGPDADAQKSDVAELKIPIRFQGNAANYAFDIAVVVLKTPIVYQTYIRPVCVDFDPIFDRRQLQDGKLGKVAGWGLTKANDDKSSAPTLQVLDMPSVRIEECIEAAPRGFREYITGDKFCAGVKKTGKALCRGDSGGGLVFADIDRGTERYYLRGIVSTAPSNDKACNAFVLTTFTQVTAHKNFIEQNTALLGDRSPNAGQSRPTLCILPPYPRHGSYQIPGTPNASPGQAFTSVQFNITCDLGYKVDGIPTLTCSDGRWSADVPQCTRFCELRKQSTVKYTCFNDDLTSVRDCMDEEPSGTSINVQCIAPYFSNDDLPAMRCIDGSWDSFPECLEDCGRVTPQEENSSVVRGLIPWYTAIYRKTVFNGSTIYSYLCIGSLVRDIVVLTAAHCFYSSSVASDYGAAVGKVYYDWDDKRDSEAQKSDIKEIKIPTRYLGKRTHYQNDIAVVILGFHVQFSKTVMPVCLDFDIIFDRSHLKDGAMGMVASWQKDSEYDIGVIQHINMTYINARTCIERQSQDFQEFITSDKICAEPVGKGVCRGDSGASLVFSAFRGGFQRHYLRGVASLAPPAPRGQTCNLNAPAAFTHTLDNERFIIGLLD